MNDNQNRTNHGNSFPDAAQKLVESLGTAAQTPPSPAKPDPILLPGLPLHSAVRLFSTEWEGERLGQVVHVYQNDPGYYSVNVSLDGFRDTAVLKRFRESTSGNTINLPVYDVPTAGPIAESFWAKKGRTCQPQFWAEPMPVRPAPIFRIETRVQEVR